MVFIHLEESCDYNQFSISDINPNNDTLPNWDDDELNQARGYTNSIDCILILGKESDGYINGEVICNNYIFDIYYNDTVIADKLDISKIFYNKIMNFPSRKIYIGEVTSYDHFYIQTKSNKVEVKVFSEDSNIEDRQHFIILLTDV